MDTSEAVEEPPKKTWSRVARTDWPDIHAAWIAGDATADICRRFNVSDDLLYQRRKLHGWPTRPTRPAIDPTRPARSISQPRYAENLRAKADRAIVQEAKAVVLNEVKALGAEVPSIIKQEIAEHFRATLATTRAIHQRVDRRVESAQEAEELRSLSVTLGNIDTVARRTYGLDSADGRNLGALVSCATSVSCPALSGAVIDVVPEPATSP